MAEVVRGTMDAEGYAEWTSEPVKPTWEQIVAMQKESAALRAQAASVLPTLPAGPTPRARRPPPRHEYPLFVPSYKDQPLHFGSLQNQNLSNLVGEDSFRGRPLERRDESDYRQEIVPLGNPAEEDSFRGRLMERRHASDSIREIMPADSGYSASKSQPLSAAPRHRHSNRSQSNTRNIELSPEASQLTGVTPKSTISVKSNGTNPPVTPISLRNMLLQENVFRKQTINQGESSRSVDLRATGHVRENGNRGRGNLPDTTRDNRAGSKSPTDASLWKGCSGTLSMVAPFAEGTSAAGSGMDASPLVSRRPDAQQSADKPKSQQQAGLFGFFPWSKKSSNLGNVGNASSDRRKSPLDKDPNKDLETLLKNLQTQLEQTEKVRIREVTELQAALKSKEQKCDKLQAHCRKLELELQMSKQAKYAPRNVQVDDIDEEDDSSSVESGSARPSRHRRVPHPSVTSELFVTTYDEVVASMRRLSRAICYHIREMGESASQVITRVLENHSIAKGRLRKAQKVLYFESFLNQIMFESFENVNFEPSGGAPVLDPEALQQISFQAFQELQSVTWSHIEQTLDEQGVIVNHSFHQFFVVRMEIVLQQLGDVGETNMPGTVISAFFDAIKAVWLLHHLAFSFQPAATILRVSQGAKFEAEYMEQVHESDRESRAKSVFLMINPGFLIGDWVVKCRVYCSSK